MSKDDVLKKIEEGEYEFFFEWGIKNLTPEQLCSNEGGFFILRYIYETHQWALDRFYKSKLRALANIILN